MALSPLKPREDRYVEVKSPPLPSRTYMLDLENGEVIDRMIDGKDALRQFIRKAIVTARYRFLIYDGQYGCELDALLGQDISPSLLKSEITRIITEALIYDDRVDKVTDFEVINDHGKLFVSFTVHSVQETIPMEVTI